MSIKCTFFDMYVHCVHGIDMFIRTSLMPKAGSYESSGESSAARSWPANRRLHINFAYIF